jgi:hypothetical protein
VIGIVGKPEEHSSEKKQKCLVTMSELAIARVSATTIALTRNSKADRGVGTLHSEKKGKVLYLF